MATRSTGSRMPGILFALAMIALRWKDGAPLRKGA
jgi:hypothetical protein